MASKPNPRLRLNDRRRRVLLAGVGAGALTALSPLVRAQVLPGTPDELDAAIKAFTQGAPVKTGKVKLDISPIVDNGNSVPITISVESPMSAAAHGKTCALFSE